MKVDQPTSKVTLLNVTFVNFNLFLGAFCTGLQLFKQHGIVVTITPDC
jgi:hypothetical protein